MSLVSYEFGAFLIVLLFFYYLVPARLQWILLLLAGGLFYASGGPFFLIYPLVTSISVWLLGGLISRKRDTEKQYLAEHTLSGTEKKRFRAEQKKKRTRFLIAGLLLNCGILAVVKYGDFLLSGAALLLNACGIQGSFAPLGLVLPLGISYYTLQAASYLIDLSRGKISHEKNLFRFILYVTFFPQMVTGPISRWSELGDQLSAPHPFRIDQLKYGAVRMLWGYFKKLVIADRMAAAVLLITQNPDTFRGFYVLLGMIGYTIWMYTDFSGGIDVVLGTAELFGISLPENFRRPFFSESLAEFWRRWHISLMSWLREYIFFPVSTSRPVLGLMKMADRLFGKTAANRIPVYCAMITVWVCAGLWHGASMNFLIWGLANCFVMLLSQELQPAFRAFSGRFALTGTKSWRVFRIFRTCLLFAVIEMFEYYPFRKVFEMTGSLLTECAPSQLAEWPSAVGLGSADLCLILCGVLLLIAVSLSEEKGDNVRKRLFERPPAVQYLLIFGLFLAVLITGIYGYGFEASQFVYNQY